MTFQQKDIGGRSEASLSAANGPSDKADYANIQTRDCPRIITGGLGLRSVTSSLGWQGAHTGLLLSHTSL